MPEDTAIIHGNLNSDGANYHISITHTDLKKVLNFREAISILSKVLPDAVIFAHSTIVKARVPSSEISMKSNVIEGHRESEVEDRCTM